MNQKNVQPFNFDLLLSGNYLVVTREGNKITDLAKTDESTYCLESRCLGTFMCWTINGKWRVGEDSPEDLLLTSIGNEPRPAFILNTILEDLRNKAINVLKNESQLTIETFLMKIKAGIYETNGKSI
jgi:hypothetical protein